MSRSHRTKTNRSHRIGNPLSLTSNGWQQSGHSRVLPPGKPPRLRFHPGTYLELEKQLYEILYAYRDANNPHEWKFCLEEREDLYGTTDTIGSVLRAMGAGSQTPRIVYEIFKDAYEAWVYFSDIPCNGDRVTVCNKTLLQKGKVVSSGTLQRTDP